MDASLMFSAPATPSQAHATHASTTASHAAPPGMGVDTSSPPSRPAHTPNGRIFAGLMRGLLPTHERQDVAAPADTANTEPGELKTEALGEQIHVITTSNALPDPDSLSAFAKAQGLDEAAVKALFGDMAAQDAVPVDAVAALQNIAPGADAAATALTPATQTTAADLAWLASQLSAEISMQISGLKQQASTPTTPSADPGLPTSLLITGETATSPMMDWAAMASAMPTTAVAPGVFSPTSEPMANANLSVTPPGTSGWAAAGVNSAISPLDLSTLAERPLAQVPLTPSPLPVASVLPPTTVLPPADLTSVALPSAGQAPASAVAVVITAPALPLNVKSPTAREALNTPLAATLGLDGLAPTQAQPEDAMRIRLVPAWAMVTQQLTQMSGAAMTSAWGALTATTLGAPIRSVALDLSSPLAADNEEPGALNGTDSGWATQGSDNARPSQMNQTLPSAAPAPGLAQTLRQEHYQQLANRLGQAMAERLQSQIARGEWKLQMRLNPANLGRIDVELDMHAKGLDAMFRSENPLTRELMVHSMPKLKDSLSQSGMAVASVWVNSDAGRQSDGNPTPQKDRNTVADTPNSTPVEIEAAPVTNLKRNQDGFDVLA